jgi:hypothetical protein
VIENEARAGGVAQVIQRLPSEALHSNPTMAPPKRRMKQRLIEKQSVTTVSKVKN